MKRTRSDDEPDRKHEALFQRFRQILDQNKDETLINDENVSTTEGLVHSLEPLPQPKIKPQAKVGYKVLKWMARPIHIDDTKVGYSDMKLLSPRMVATLDAMGIQETFPVQTAVIPAVLADAQNMPHPDPLSDVLVNAYTGSGKTLAYAVPVIESLASRVVPRLRALVVVPTRPLVQQVRAVIESLAKGTSLSVMGLRIDRPLQQEQKLLRSNVPDILVCNPGRLVDHLQKQSLDLSCLRFLVIDEADRLMNQSFQGWINVLMDELDRYRPPGNVITEKFYTPVRKLIFSATLTRDPEKLAALKIHDPLVFVLSGQTDDEHTKIVSEAYEFSTPDMLTEWLVPIGSGSEKPLKLVQLLVELGIRDRTFVFAKSSETAERLAQLIPLICKHVFPDKLETPLVVDSCTGELALTKRNKKLRQFGQGEIGILVCTDLVARGIDISSVRHVINYDLPTNRRDYVHRVGRTARAGEAGVAWSLAVEGGEQRYFWSIVSKIYRKEGRKVSVHKLSPEVEDGYTEALQELEQRVLNHQ